MKKILIVFAAALFALNAAAFADTVFLKGGDRVSGKVSRASEDSVTVETEYGKLVIPGSRIERIKESDPEREEYLRRLKGLVRSHKELAQWCREEGLEDRARESLETARRLEKLLVSEDSPEKSGPVSNMDVFNAVWEAVRDNFYDRENYNGCDWDTVKKKYHSRARDAGGKVELYDVINEMLGELNASHCYLWSPYVWKDHVGNEFRGEKTRQAGIEILKIKEKYFVRSVYHGGPADKAGVRVGDELVNVDGISAGKSERVVLKDGISSARRALFTLHTEDGAKLILGLRRKKGGEIVKAGIKPEMTSMLEGAKNSVRVIERGGKKLGYIRLWHFMNRGISRVFREAVDGKLKDCDGLVLDIRGRGGSPWVIREVLRVFTRGRWARPAVLVVDEDTSSAKEIFAYHWKKSKLGPVVGRKTAGHVLGSGMIPMPDGSMLLLARVKVTRMTDDRDLEGDGVEPDVEVKKTFEYCGGRHPLIEKAIQTLLEHCKKKVEEPLFKQYKPSREAA